MRYPKWFDKFRKREVDHFIEEATIGNDVPPVSEVEAFKRNGIWKYIFDTINFRIKSARDDLENQHLDIETMRVYQGRVEELRFIASLPDFIIENFKELQVEVDAKKAADEVVEENKQEVRSWIKE